MNRITYYY